MAPGAVARSDARPPSMRMVTCSIITSAKTFFRGDLVMEKNAILPLPLIQEGQMSVTGERMYIKSTGKLPRRLARNSVDRLSDRDRNDL